MAIQLVCACGRALVYADELAGTRGRCLYCGAEVAIPGRPAEVPCPQCGRRIDAVFETCPFCNARLDAPGGGGMVECPGCQGLVSDGAGECPFCRRKLSSARGTVEVAACRDCGSLISGEPCPFCHPPAVAAPAPRAPTVKLPAPAVERERAPAPERRPVELVPWEDGGRSPVWRFGATWSRSLFAPKDFFRTLRYEGEWGPPLTYVVALVMLASLAGLPVRWVFGGFEGGPLAPAIMAGVWLSASLFGAVLGPYVWAGLLHAICRVLGGGGATRRRSGRRVTRRGRRCGRLCRWWGGFSAWRGWR